MIRRLLSIFIVVSATVLTVMGVEDSPLPPTMSASFEADSVGIGDHIALNIEVDQDVMQVVAFPEFELGDGSLIEMVGIPTLDTLSKEGRRLKLRRRYLLTSFEAGFYNIGPASILYIDKNVTDTLYSPDSLRLFVGTYLIDSTSHSIFDLKPVRDLPFKFKEVSGYATWLAIGIVLLALLIYAVLRLMAHYGRPVFGLFKPAPPVPPHVAALAALDTLKSEHLWQSGEYKGYYSRLTDILRTYISGRYGVAAMEMTSLEIITASRDLELPSRCQMELQELLRDADLVKFAKAEFDATQNERYFESTRVFVELTKVVEESEEEDGAESKTTLDGAEKEMS